MNAKCFFHKRLPFKTRGQVPRTEQHSAIAENTQLLQHHLAHDLALGNKKLKVCGEFQTSDIHSQSELILNLLVVLLVQVD